MSNIYCGDCIDIMSKVVKDGSVDCVIADPPYNVSRKNNFQTMSSARRQGMDFGEWDKGFDNIKWIGSLPRVLKENSNVVIFNSWQNLQEIATGMMENNITPKRCLVLAKSNPAPFNRDRMFVNDTEFAVWGVYNSKGKPSKWTFHREGPVEKTVLPTTVQSSKLHPTMKDILVIEKLVRVLSNPNDIVLDPFMGSGTTGVACRNWGRNFIGIELDIDYYEIARKRIYNVA